MLLDPSNLLLLDEPTNHLDMVSRSIVEEAMASFEGSIVCISHDRHFLNKITNITCEVGKGGVITYQGNYEYYHKHNSALFRDVVKKSFQGRRKMIKNTLKTSYKNIIELMAISNIPENSRPENITLRQFCHLTDAIDNSSN